MCEATNFEWLQSCDIDTFLDWLECRCEDCRSCGEYGGHTRYCGGCLEAYKRDWLTAGHAEDPVRCDGDDEQCQG